MTRAAPSPADPAPALWIAQVAAGSPLGRRIGIALDGCAELQFDIAARPAHRPWRRNAAATGLQWWDDPAPPAPSASTSPITAITVDLHGSAALADRAARVWQIVDGAGLALLHPMHALHACHREPCTASLFLVERTAAAPHGRVLAEAHLSSVVAYRRLLGALGAAAAGLLRRGLARARSPARPWRPGPPAPRRRFALPRAHAATAAHWLRARFGGDLYGIAVLDQPPAACLGDATLSPPHWLQVDAAHGFIADPFFWPGRPGVILCEAYSHRTGLGALASLIAGEQGPPDIQALSAADHHLSYPYAWPDGGRVLCLPEMAAARRQVLYELHAGESDPRRAMLPVCVVAENVAMADPTIFHDGGLYWLTYTDAEQGLYDNLCLMFSERPEGPWRAHPGNPVKVDVRSSRPGGTPFRVGGQLFRPAQDCSRTYGGALAINAVTECTTERYAEHVVAMLRPDPAGAFPDGVHTLAVSQTQMLIDGKRISFHPAIAWHKVMRRARATLLGGLRARSPATSPAAK